MKRIWLCAAAAIAIGACDRRDNGPTIDPIAAEPEQAAPSAQSADERLDAALNAQPSEEQARYAARHPKETLQFFGVEPGMTVVEVLPGGGWWTKILLPYLGENGRVIGADYALSMWALFGEFSPDPEKQKTWPSTWPEEAAAWCAADCASLDAFAYGATPDAIKGTADAVLMFRAFHHFSRLEDDGGYMSAALKDTFEVLKPGGIVGVEQHRAPAGHSDAWADGENGYVKQSAVIAAFEAAGFEFVEASEINANPKDQPTEQDFVWRLPPTFATSQDNPELKAQMAAIGESDRMTLKFRKPSQ